MNFATSRSVGASKLRGYGIAVSSTFVAVLVRKLFAPYLGNDLPFLTLFLAVTFTSWWCGFGPAMLTVIVGYLAVFYLFIPPHHRFVISGFTAWAETVIFFVVGFAMAWFAKVQRSAQAKAQENEQKYRSLYLNTPVMIQSMDKEGRILNINNCWMETLGYQQAEVTGHEFVEFLTPESRKHAEQEVLPEYIKSGVSREVNYKLVKQTGETIDVLFSVITEKAVAGREGRSLAALVDVTAQKRAEDQIRLWNYDLEKLVRERTSELEAFCYSVSHDLRAPVRQIASFTELLHEDYEPLFTKEAREMLQIVIQSAKRMDQLINDLLTLSRLSRCEMQRRTVDLSALVTKIVAVIQKNNPGRKVDMVIGSNVIARGDERMLQIALENLIGNAWKFTARRNPGRIEFGAEQMEGQPVYYLRDNGVGFNMEHYGKLFGVFERLHTDAEFQGTGIGLAIVDRIISRQGGKIWATGEVDKGATFYFTLEDNGNAEVPAPESGNKLL